MNNLSQLPNIGKVLAQKLMDAEIETPEKLIQIDAEQAFLKLSIEDTSACFNMLCALEGTIQGIRWHQLSTERKLELKEFLQLRKII